MKIEKKSKSLLILFLVFCFIFTIFTRFYRLGDAPETLNVDEANHGYIAYSLLKTGKDEHGVNYPLVFKAFGDYKLPAYPYLLAPLLKFLPLSNFVVRLPSAIAGILLIIGIYLLFIEWGFKKKLAFLAALIMLCSPWSFFLSRFAYESNLALAFFVWALYLFFKYKDRNHFFLFSSVLFALTTYSYVSYKIIAPLFVLALTFYYFFKKPRKTYLFINFLIPFLIFIIPLFIGQQANSNLARFKQVGFLSDKQVALEINENRHYCLADYPKTFCYLTWNKYSSNAINLFKKFIRVFSPNYLFIDGEERLYYLGVEKTGQFLILLLPLYFLGFFHFIKEYLNKSSKNKELLYLATFGFLITPLPAVLSGIQKIRLSALLPFIILIIVWGYQLMEHQFKKLSKLIDLAVFASIIISFFIFFVNFSTIHVIKHDFNYDYFVKDIFISLAEIEDDYDEIVIKEFFSDPIMYYAYYRQIDPVYYQNNVVLKELEKSGFQHAFSLGKYKTIEGGEGIAQMACQAVLSNKNILYVGNDFSEIKSLVDNKSLIKIIRSTNGALDYAYIFDVSSYGQYLTSQNKCL